MKEVKKTPNFNKKQQLQFKSQIFYSWWITHSSVDEHENMLQIHSAQEKISGVETLDNESITAHIEKERFRFDKETTFLPLKQQKNSEKLVKFVN